MPSPTVPCVETGAPRVRCADAGETPRYRVADAVVTEATERIGDFPDSVDGTDIEIIDWSG